MIEGTVIVLGNEGLTFLIGLCVILFMLSKFKQYFKREVETDYHWYGKNDDTRVTNYN